MGEVAGVSATVHVTDSVTPALAHLARQLRNLDPALDEMGSSLVTETQLRFEAEKAPDGKPWKSLAESTLAKRNRVGSKGGTARILRDQGDLYDSVTHQVHPGVGVSVGVTRTCGRIHQLGGQAGRGHKVTILARPYLGLTDDSRAELEAILKDHLARGAA